MKNWLVISCLVWMGACAAQVPGDESAAWSGEPQSEQVEGSAQALQLTQPINLADLPVATANPLTPADQSPELVGMSKCTPERQDACDGCVDGCDYLCSRNDGGGQAGGCIGLFCPTRCDSCVLGCYKTCGKCKPSQF